LEKAVSDARRRGPRRSGEASSTAAIEAEPEEAPDELGAKILIVDDDRLCRALLDELLAEYGTRHQAECGRDALRFIALSLEEEAPYDLVCLDIMMPGLDGHGVLDEIRRLDAEYGREGNDATKVVMTTALRDSSHCVQAFREGCEAYLTKPVDEESLVQALGDLGLAQPEGSAC
jgi:two-component system chemotaxis response regulator CheY